MPLSPAALASWGVVLVVSLWGCNFVFTKVGLESLSPLAFAGLRAVLAAGVLWAFLAWQREGLRRLSKREHVFVGALGIIGNGLFLLLYTLGLNHTSAANGALIVAASPVMVVALGQLLGLERPSKAAWWGAGLSVLGIVLVVGRGLELGSGLLGDVIMVGTMLAWVAYTLGAKPLLMRHSPLTLTAYGSLWGAGVLLAVSFPALYTTSWQTVTPASWGAAFYAGAIATGFAYILWNRSVSVVGPARTSIYINLIPVVAVVVGFFVLGERLVLVQGVGAVLIISGVVLAQRPARATLAPVPPAPPR
jgi:drug/metabolite transporter (DMT)-like permease